MLFKLRGVDHEELIAADAEAAVSVVTKKGKSKRIAANAISDVFGIELAAPAAPPQPAAPAKVKAARRKRAAKAAAAPEEVVEEEPQTKVAAKKTRKKRVA